MYMFVAMFDFDDFVCEVFRWYFLYRQSIKGQLHLERFGNHLRLFGIKVASFGVAFFFGNCEEVDGSC